MPCNISDRFGLLAQALPSHGRAQSLYIAMDSHSAQTLYIAMDKHIEHIYMYARCALHHDAHPTTLSLSRPIVAFVLFSVV